MSSVPYIYVGAGHQGYDNVWRIDPTTMGVVGKWTAAEETPSAAGQSPKSAAFVHDNELLYCVARPHSIDENRAVYAIDPETMTIVFQSGNDVFLGANAIVDGGDEFIYIGGVPSEDPSCTDGPFPKRVLRVDPNTLEIVAVSEEVYPGNPCSIREMKVVDGRIYAAGAYSTGEGIVSFALPDLNDKKVYNITGSHLGGFELIDGFLYAGEVWATLIHKFDVSSGDLIDTIDYNAVNPILECFNSLTIKEIVKTRDGQMVATAGGWGSGFLFIVNTDPFSIGTAVPVSEEQFGFPEAEAAGSYPGFTIRYADGYIFSAYSSYVFKIKDDLSEIVGLTDLSGEGVDRLKVYTIESPPEDPPPPIVHVGAINAVSINGASIGGGRPVPISLVQFVSTGLGNERFFQSQSSLGESILAWVGWGFGLPQFQHSVIQIGMFTPHYQKYGILLSRGDYLSSPQALNFKLLHEVRTAQKLVGVLSDSVLQLQNQLNSLSRGDQTRKDVSIQHGLIEEVRKIQQIKGVISHYFHYLQSIANILSRGDFTPGVLLLMPDLVESISKAQLLDGVVSGHTQQMQQTLLLLSRGENTEASNLLVSDIADETKAILSLISELSGHVQTVHQNINTLSGDPFLNFQSSIVTLMEKNDIYTLQKIATMLAEFSAIYSTTVLEVYLDGRPLSKKIASNSIEISYDESTVHNEIVITGNDPEVFGWADPNIHYGEPRIEAQIGGRLMYFLVETREGETIDYKITGISVSAKEDTPYTNSIDFYLEAATLASEVADSLTVFCPVVWEAHNWVVPKGFEFNGPPIEGILRLAQAIGAVVRCQDDGSLLVRNRRPVRPVDMPTAGFHVSYNMEDTVSLSHSEIPESGYNAIQVMGQTSEYDFPILQVEEVKTDGELDEHGMPPTRRPYRGETTYVRVFWGGEPRNVVDSYSTDGSIEVVGGGVFYSEERIETVHFEDGLGRVSLPVEDLISWEWVGDSASSVNYTRHSMELKIPDTKFRIAVVKYKILFQRYMLTGHDVEQLIAVLFLESKPDVFMKIRTAQDPVYGSSIEDALLSDEAAAVVRGTSWIDQQYRKSLIRLSAPYKEEALDGRIAYINDARIGSPGNYHIQKSVISINGPVVKNEIEVEKCLTLFNL